MNGCPIQKVHKLKSKRREKLKKYLYQGSSKQDNKYQTDKYKMQSGNSGTLEMTPDYHFNRILDPKKETYHQAIVNQIESNQYKRDQDYRIERDNEKMQNNWYEKKMAKYDRKVDSNRKIRKKKFLNDIGMQIRQNKHKEKF